MSRFPLLGKRCDYPVDCHGALIISNHAAQSGRKGDFT